MERAALSAQGRIAKLDKGGGLLLGMESRGNSKNSAPNSYRIGRTVWRGDI